MYKFYFGKVELPITPGKLEIKANNKNKTMTLLNDGEINILKTPGLTEISFDISIPQVKYPFVNVKKLQKADYYLEMFEKMKTQKKSFRFIVARITQGGKNLFDTNMLVSLEDYTIKEDAGNGIDLVVSVKLKQYRNYSTKIFQEQQAKIATAPSAKKVVFIPAKEERPPSANQLSNKTYTVKSGDCLWNICKQYLGDGSKYPEIAKLNNISNPNLIYPGMILKLG